MLAVLSGLAFFSGMDAIMKGLVLALGTFNAIYWRMLAGLVLAGLLFFAAGTRWPAAGTLKLHLLRGCVSGVMGFTFFWGLGRVPLAEAIALSFIAPLIALYLAAVMLKEEIGRSAVIASLLGLAGVVVILAGKMSGEFPAEARWGVGAVLVSAVLYAWNLVLQRRQAQIASPIEIAFFQTAIITLLYLPFVPFLAVAPDAAHWPAIAGAAALAIVSLLLISWGYARAEAQHLVSIEYTAFIWAAFFGWMFFEEAVSWATFLGTALIVAGCMLVARQKPKKAEIVEAAAL